MGALFHVTLEKTPAGTRVRVWVGNYLGKMFLTIGIATIVGLLVYADVLSVDSVILLIEKLPVVLKLSIR